ncbi:hypothetical protein J6590_078727 [Homalodisca vitripennis]|nr:hypothetical protein J6590_078727 [Homalodisca vitripennis]
MNTAVNSSIRTSTRTSSSQTKTQYYLQNKVSLLYKDTLLTLNHQLARHKTPEASIARGLVNEQNICSRQVCLD